jgi:hypothetical protein
MFLARMAVMKALHRHEVRKITSDAKGIIGGSGSSRETVPARDSVVVGNGPRGKWLLKPSGENKRPPEGGLCRLGYGFDQAASAAT